MMMFSASDFFDRSEQSWNQSWSPQTFTENKPLWFLHQLQVSVFFIKGAASWLSGTFVYGCSFIKTIFSLVCTQWCFLHLYSFITFNTFKLFPAVFHFSTKLSQKIIFKLFRLQLKFKQIFWNQMKWVRVCACVCACRTCLEPSSGVRCSNRRSLESLCAAEVQLMEAVRETSSRRRQRRREEEFIFVTCVSVCGSEDLLLLSRHGGSFKAPLTSLPRAVGWVWWWVEGGDWWWWWWCLVKWAGFKFLPSSPPSLPPSHSLCFSAGGSRTGGGHMIRFSTGACPECCHRGPNGARISSLIVLLSNKVAWNKRQRRDRTMSRVIKVTDAVWSTGSVREIWTLPPKDWGGREELRE